MLIRLSFVLILAGILSPNLSSQTSAWAPAGARWYYNTQAGLKGYAVVESVQDTFLVDVGINGSQCNLKSFYYYAPWDTVRTGADFNFVTYATGDTIMARWNGQETIFFIQNDGACWNYASPDSLFAPFRDTSEICVDSLGSYTIGDTTFPTAYYTTFTNSHSFQNNGPFVPNIGFVNYFLPEPGYIQDITFSGPIRCYYDPANGLLKLNDTIACDSLYLNDEGLGWVVDPLPFDDLKIWPNPATQRLNIKTAGNYDIRALEVYDMSGRKVAHRKMEGNRAFLWIGDWTQGLYLIKVFFENHPPVSGKILKQ